MAIAVAATQVGRPDWYCPITQSGRELSPRQLRYALDLYDLPRSSPWTATNPADLPTSG
jgi:hypothetical protein